MICLIIFYNDKDDKFPSPKKLGERKIEEYRLNGKLSRIDGAAVIDSGYSNKDSKFYSKPKLFWFINGKELPNEYPKLIGKNKMGDWSDVGLLKVLSFDLHYAKFLLNNSN